MRLTMTADMATHRDGPALHERISLALQFEPSWFAEFMSATGIFWWSVFACCTDDFTVRGWAWAMPAAGLLFGPLRMALLFRLTPMPRVVVACIGFVWWAGLFTALFHRTGAAPLEGAAVALAIGDALTVAKFSHGGVLEMRRDQTSFGGD